MFVHDLSSNGASLVLHPSLHQVNGVDCSSSSGYSGYHGVVVMHHVIMEWKAEEKIESECVRVDTCTCMYVCVCVCVCDMCVCVCVCVCV